LLAVAAIVAVGFVILSGSGDSLTHAYELNGTLDDDLGGDPARQTGGTLTAEGYEFTRGDGLTIYTDLGESFTIEARLRLDSGPPERYLDFVKLFDFRDRSRDAGLYVFGKSRLAFYFSDDCGGVADPDQGCSSVTDRLPMYGPPGSFPMGVFTTVSLVRDGETGMVEAYVDGELQTWLPSQSSPSNVQRLEAFHDLDGEATQDTKTMIHVMLDDGATGGVESGTGEIDYIHITKR
jgi:hypothetical protein